ncbi:MAG: acetoin utilization protein AcuC [Candidatus Hermodarchaeota archaeon]
MIKTGIIWSDQYTEYNLGETHPMNPKRLLVPYHLFKSLKIFELPQIQIFTPYPTSESNLLLFHTSEYIKAVKVLAEIGGGSRLKYGLGTGDCPVFPEMHETSRFIVGGALEGVKRIQKGDVQQAFAILGGLHHAFAERAAGFCYYNDVVIAIKYLQQEYGVNRVLYIDTDVHHGDGVLNAFYSDKSVLGISIHESGQFLFPGTGYSNEIGENEGTGYSINIPLFPGTWDDLYIKIFDSIIPCLWNEFDPEFIIWQCGADGHSRDILGHLNLTTMAYNYLGQRIAELSRNCSAQGKLLLLGGGGYNPDSVARAWLAILAGITGIELPVSSPKEWIDFCDQEFNLKVSPFIHDEPINIEKIDKPAMIEEANFQYLQVLKEELHGISIWKKCSDSL